MRHGTAFGLGRTACDATPVVAIGSKTAGCSYSGFAGWQCSHELALRRKGRSGKDFERRVPDCLLFKALSKKLQFGSSLSTLDRDLKVSYLHLKLLFQLRPSSSNFSVLAWIQISLGQCGVL